jgi:hypothetical protein
MILLISASYVARITGVSHQHLAEMGSCLPRQTLNSWAQVTLLTSVSQVAGTTGMYHLTWLNRALIEKR